MKISSHQEAVRILQDLKYASDRTIQENEFFRSNSHHPLPYLCEFTRGWLMLMDGERHANERRRVIQALRSSAHPTREEIDSIFNQINNGMQIDNRLIHKLTADWHRRILGLSTRQQYSLISLSQTLLDFFLADQRRGYNMGAFDLFAYRLANWYSLQRFAEGYILSSLEKEGVSEGIRVNMAIDSFSPMRNALETAFYLGSQLPEAQLEILSDKDLATEGLRSFPPFRYINRLSPIEEPHEQRPLTTIDLLLCNSDLTVFRDPADFRSGRSSPHLSFGIGRHACPGAGLSMQFLMSAWRSIRSLRRFNRLRLISGETFVDRGECRVADLVIVVDE